MTEPATPEVPTEEPDIPPPGRPPPPPPPDASPLNPAADRPSSPKRTPDGRVRPPFPSYPDDAPELIRNVTAGIRNGPCAAMRGYVSLDWPGRR